MKLYNQLNSIISFFILLGFYSLLLVTFSYLSISDVTKINIGIRLFLLLLMAILFILKPFKYNKYLLFLFFLFSLIYCMQIGLAILDGGEEWERSPGNILKYYIMYAIVPFIFFARKKVNNTQISMKKIIIYSGILFSILTTVFYFSFLMDFGGRINMLHYVTDGDTQALNPLIFSYVSSITLGLIIYELFSNIHLTRLDKIFYYIGVVISIIPYSLGASRGSIFSLLLPFFYIFFIGGKNIKKRHLFFSVLGFVLLIGIISNVTGSSLIVRFTSITSDIRESSTSASRLDLWKTSLEQASGNIITGNGLQNDITGAYPHNIFVEVIMATGVLGLGVFLLIIFFAFKISNRITKYDKDYIWMVIIFQQGLIRAQFTGAIADSIFFWSGLGMVYSVAHLLQRRKI
jgi:O-antigen ligase